MLGLGVGAVKQLLPGLLSFDTHQSGRVELHGSLNFVVYVLCLLCKMMHVRKETGCCDYHSS